MLPLWMKSNGNEEVANGGKGAVCGMAPFGVTCQKMPVVVTRGVLKGASVDLWRVGLDAEARMRLAEPSSRCNYAASCSNPFEESCKGKRHDCAIQIAVEKLT